MNVLSLFDGMSCGQISLNRLGVKIDNYFASEVDKYAIQVTKANYPNTNHIGDVRNIDVSTLPKIDLLLGGSLCQNFSFAGSRKGMTTKEGHTILELNQYLELKKEGFEFEGQSYLFWEYVRIYRELKKINPDVKFLLENVVMSKDWEWIISKQFDVHPIKINSALLSAQNRNRLYWTNIGLVQYGLFGEMKCGIKQPKDKGIILKDVIEHDVDEKYFLSEKAIKGLEEHTKKMKERGNGFEFKPTEGNNKAKILTNRNGSRPDDNYIVAQRGRNPENPKDRTPGKETKQMLEARNDGKTYCLDTGQSNAVEIIGGDFRHDEGFRFRKNGKSSTLVTRDNAIVKKEKRIRRLTPIECERLQTVPDNYTNHVSDTQRYKMLGNGWTIDVICHILKHL